MANSRKHKGYWADRPVRLFAGGEGDGGGIGDGDGAGIGGVGSSGEPGAAAGGAGPGGPGDVGVSPGDGSGAGGGPTPTGGAATGAGAGGGRNSWRYRMGNYKPQTSVTPEIYRPQYQQPASQNMSISQYGQYNPFSQYQQQYNPFSQPQYNPFSQPQYMQQAMQQYQQPYNPFSQYQQYQQPYNPFAQQYQPQYQPQYSPMNGIYALLNSGMFNSFFSPQQPSVQQPAPAPVPMRTSSGPSQPIYSRSSIAQGSPSIRAYAGGGIVGLLK